MSTEAEWCDYGDMPKIMCEHCQTGKKNAGTNRGLLGVSARSGVASGHRGPIGLDVPDQGRAVPATFNGTCPICHLPIRTAGKATEMAQEETDADWIVRVKRGWAHESCAEEG